MITVVLDVLEWTVAWTVVANLFDVLPWTSIYMINWNSLQCHFPVLPGYIMRKTSVSGEPRKNYVLKEPGVCVPTPLEPIRIPKAARGVYSYFCAAASAAGTLYAGLCWGRRSLRERGNEFGTLAGWLAGWLECWLFLHRVEYITSLCYNMCMFIM